MKPISSIRRRLLPTLFAALLLHGCVTRPPTAPGAAGPPPAPDAAASAEIAGDYVLAAQLYDSLARAAQPPQRQNYQLKAVEALIKAAQIREARDKLGALDVSGLDPAYLARRRILEAQLAVFEGQQDRALRLLAQTEQTRGLAPELLADIYRVRAQAELSLGNPIRAVQNYIARERFIVGPELLTANQHQLWQVLEPLSRTRLKQELDRSRDPVLSGWLTLAMQVLENTSSLQQLANAVSNWRLGHPQHPATQEFLRDIAKPAPGSIGRVDRIALLLPLSSSVVPVAQAAGAVRDGFLAMDAANTDPDKPKLHIYDTGSDPERAIPAYAQAVSEGAQLVVGPLGLDAVDALVKKADLTVPTLLLSHTSQELTPSRRNVFQFGLPPEQEAAQVAERAYLDGYRRAGVLYPESAWGQRMLAAFSAHWQRLGGIVVASEPYAVTEKEYSGPVKRLLNINSSELRRDQLANLIRTPLQFTPRTREDMDFLFLAATDRQARLIKPQLNYHRASKLPVYATSHVFTGRGDRVLDIDLDGIMFGDMPWMLVGDGRVQELRSKVQRDWPYAHTQLDRLYALGMDAYSVIPQLNSLSSENSVRFNGVTSGLSLGRNGSLHRQLIWAQFRAGVPKLLDTFLPYRGQYDTPGGSDAAAPAGR